MYEMVGIIGFIVIVAFLAMMVDLVISGRETCKKLHRIVNLLEEQAGRRPSKGKRPSIWWEHSEP